MADPWKWLFYLYLPDSERRRSAAFLLQPLILLVRTKRGFPVLQSLKRLGLASLFLLSAVATTDAAPIFINELSTGGGTVVNDGSGDVSSSEAARRGPLC